MHRLRTRRMIPYPPAQVWAVLTDFKAYAEWNPLDVWAGGDGRLGAQVPMRFVDAGSGKGKIIAQTATGLWRTAFESVIGKATRTPPSLRGERLA